MERATSIEMLPIANIVRVEFVTEEDTPKTYRLTDVATDAEATVYLSEGERNPLRVKNRIHAQNNTEDIVLGYDLRFVNALMVPEVIALFDGGTLKFDDTDPDKVIGYDAPVMGEVVDRKPFTTHIYAEEKDCNGDTMRYIRFIYPHCKGKPVDYSYQDGEFFAPELEAMSTPKCGESPSSFEILDELPE